MIKRPATLTIYDASGKMVSEYSTVLNATPEVSYLTSDILGSPRINTNENGAVTARHDFYPFGEEISSSQRTGGGYAGDEIRKKFTSYERDDESGLDFAQARYYPTNQGRFSSPDPHMASAKTVSPQTWNRYSYILNNPINLIDPSGLDSDPPPCTSTKEKPCTADDGSLVYPAFTLGKDRCSDNMITVP